MLTKLRHMSGTAQPSTLDALLAQCQRGNQQAFAQLYQQHVGAVYALCMRMTANVGLAEDCTQQAFVNAWRSLDKFRGDAQFSTWLHRIAVNAVLAARRSSQRREQFEVAVEQDAGDLVTQQWSPAEHDDRALEASIARLPERQRQVFVLHAVYGFSQAEVAGQLEIAVGSVKAHYHSARRQLQRSLGDPDER